MPGQPEISFVVPVYNKADILPRVIAALGAQTLDVPVEYVFVDDASRDGSADILQAGEQILPAMQVLRNAGNAGPGIRLNQGAEQARGRYLCLIDADELVAPDAVATMLRLAREANADMVHGKVARATDAGADFRPPAIGKAPIHHISDRPLETILTGRGFVRMAWLVETALFHASGGCDQRLFIQDESLPLRLAHRARRLIDLQASVMWALPAASHLSADKRQQHHDRFFAYYNFLHDHPELPVPTRSRVAATCLSTAWKALRRSGLQLAFMPMLTAYLAGSAGLGISERQVEAAAAAFRAMPGIRRPGAGQA